MTAKEIIKDYSNKINHIDCREGLKNLPDESIDCVITSPPYYGLRTYGDSVKVIWDGDKECNHEWSIITKPAPGGCPKKKVGVGNWDRQVDDGSFALKGQPLKSDFCIHCGAWKGELGLEPDYKDYIRHLLQIFTEIKRVLKKTGSFWLNIGDTYAGSQCGNSSYPDPKLPQGRTGKMLVDKRKTEIRTKSLMGLPWRIALTMIDEQGWILRNSVIWYKPSHMPESVQDRLTKTYEFLFHFVKSPKYFYDLSAIRVPHKEVSLKRLQRAVSNKHKYINSPEYGGGGGINKPRPNTKKTKIPVNTAELFGSPQVRYHREQNASISQFQFGEGDYLVVNLHPDGKNPGDMWSISSEPFKDAHFAVFPTALVKKPILTTCPQWICKHCGHIKERITKRIGKGIMNIRVRRAQKDYPSPQVKASEEEMENYKETWEGVKYQTIGWTECNCSDNDKYEPGIVLDPFAGTGTTCAVAHQLGRNYIGFELNPDYTKMRNRELAQEVLKF
ncbi:MAG: site-specific DNA-methyltransferase [bacterium]